MRKTVIAALVLAAILLLAPNALGRFAESRSDAMLDQMVSHLPYLSIVERDWERGWFTSRQRVTFESRLPVGGESRPRFTVHNRVLHGPLLGLSGIGAARVKTDIDLPASMQQDIRDTFGPEPALEATTRLGFLGGGSTRLTSRGRTVTAEDGSEMEYDTVKFTVDFNRDISAYEIDSRMPRIEIRGTDGQNMVFDRLTLAGEADRIDGYQYLYDSSFDLRLRALVIDGPQGEFRLKDAHYTGDLDVDEGLFAMQLRMGSGDVEGATVESTGLAISEVNYDLTLRHLHAQTVDSIYGSMQALYRDAPFDQAEDDPDAIDEAMSQSVLDPLAQHAGALLAHDPELSLDRIGFVTPEGEAVLTGVIRVTGMSEQDFQFGGFLAVLGKLQADLTFEIDTAVAEKLPNGEFLSQTGVSAGYVVREEDKLVARIGFRDGALIINGQSQAVPLPGMTPGIGPGLVPPPEFTEPELTEPEA